MTEGCRGDCKGHPLNCYDHPHDCPCSAEPSDEDVERAAIGAATAHYGSFVWERAPQEVQERWRNIARAAIAALRAKP